MTRVLYRPYMERRMKAMILNRMVSLHEVDNPLELVDIPVPAPGDGEVRVKVSACGVCHTELDEIEGRIVPPGLPIVLGHEVVGKVEARGANVTQVEIGDRVGVGWIFSSSGNEQENLSPQFRATGRDANGGYAEYMVVPANYAIPIPEEFGDAEAAPLLCAGAIGYRALNLTGISDGDRLGLTGFGGSAHLVLQLVRHLYPTTKIYVFARDRKSRDFALSLGADWSGATTDRSPKPLHAVIDTTPAWQPVVEALKNLRPGGRLVVNAIRKEEHDKECLQRLNYHDHLWMEKELKSVANITRNDITRFLSVAAEIPIKPHIQTYRLEDANRALIELKHGNVQGAKVLMLD